ncbi:MAG: AEC family transporter [Deltaproteobacteria bacterium]|jgi:predicted permease|nr:AEC family transporter [Deltaproteobacteria bacterium]
MSLVLSSLFPVFSLLLVGSLLKRLKLTNEMFLKLSDRLVYFIFFPVLLFWKIGGAEVSRFVNWNLCIAVVISIAITYVISALALKLFNISDHKAGSFSQSCYRFNTYIGMAIIFYAFGEEGIKHFGLLIGFAIPFINILAVSTLIWYSGKTSFSGHRVGIFFKEIFTNPLVLSCAAGLAYSRMIGSFPVYIDNTFRLMSAAALPLALISIGGALTMKGLRSNLVPSAIGSIIKLLFLPLVGFFVLKELQVTGLPFRVGMIFFMLPTSASIYVLSSQLNSDTELASAAIVLSTILSFFSLSAGLMF